MGAPRRLRSEIHENTEDRFVIASVAVVAALGPFIGRRIDSEACSALLKVRSTCGGEPALAPLLSLNSSLTTSSRTTRTSLCINYTCPRGTPSSRSPQILQISNAGRRFVTLFKKQRRKSQSFFSCATAKCLFTVKYMYLWCAHAMILQSSPEDLSIERIHRASHMNSTPLHR